MYIRYNNSPNQRPPQYQGENYSKPPPEAHYSPHHIPSGRHRHEADDDKCDSSFKNPLHFLPKEIYNPETHKFFGKVSSEDILILGLILLVLDHGQKDDFLLVLALLYILFSDSFDLGNILT